MKTKVEEEIELLDVSEMEGIGPAKAKKLNEAGIFDVYDLATKFPEDIANLLGITKDAAKDLINKATEVLEEKKKIRSGVMTSREVLEEMQNIEFSTTGSEMLDYLLGGGIATKNITEFYGQFASGKTQICHTSAVMAVQKGWNVLWVDTEGTYRPDRVKAIAEVRNVNVDKVLDSVFCIRIHSASHLELISRALSRIIKEKNIKLIIIDSIISQHRAEYIGRGTLSDRQGRLNQIIQYVAKVVDIMKVAAIFTNQVMSDPGAMFGDPTKPTGGNILGHASGTRVYLRRSSKENRTAILEDSSGLPPMTVHFRITEKGIEDNEEELEKFKKGKEESS